MVRCHGLFGKHDLSISANGEVACSRCKRRWDPHNNGQEILPYGYKSWEAWHKEALQKHNGQTIYPGSRPETHYGGYDTRLDHEYWRLCLQNISSNPTKWMTRNVSNRSGNWPKRIRMISCGSYSNLRIFRIRKQGQS